MMNKKKKIALALTSTALAATLLIGSTLAFFTDRDTRENIVTMGKVDGTLTEDGEITREDGTTGLDFTNVKPGDEVDKEPVITLASDSEAAYVRVALSFPGLSDQQAADVQAELTLNEGWVKSGDYYYFKQILSNTEGGLKTATIFNQVKIPSTWGNEVADLKFNINVTAELIQAANLDITKDDAGMVTGWPEVTIEAYQSM